VARFEQDGWTVLATDVHMSPYEFTGRSVTHGF
jgi:hypothetical protein